MLTHSHTNEAESLFRSSGAVLDGHFLLTSGLHSPVYWEKFRILERPEYTSRLCAMIATHFKDCGAQVVIGPTTGGIILAFEVAKQMGLRCIFAEKNENGQRTFRRGFSINPEEKVLVVDDILTTGKSVKEVLCATAEHNGIVVGIGVLVDRSEHGLDFGFPLFSCLRSLTAAYQQQDCPLCRQGIPLVKPGSSKQVIA